MQEKKLIFSTGISLGSYRSMLDRIFSLAEARRSSYVCTVNVHMLTEAARDKDFEAVVNNADLATADGVPVAKVLKWLYGIKQERVAGMDLLPDLLRESERKKLPVFFFGSTPGVLAQISQRVRKELPLLSFATLSPPFREFTDAENNAWRKQIDDFSAAIVFVGLGCPRQEKWMAAMKGKINAVMIGVGGAFPVYAGLQKRAPYWMQRLSLEWLFRFGQDPRRLWKRYFSTNLYFISRLALFKLHAGKKMIVPDNAKTT